MDDSISADEFGQLAQSRSKLYGFLSALYVRIPNNEFATTLLGEKFLSLRSIAASDEVSSEMKEGLRTMERFVEETKDRPRNKLAEELAVEWTRLFRGLKRGYGPPPPYESVYKEGSGQDSRQGIGDVMKIYREAGVGMDEKAGQRVDYVGVELDFMRHLTENETELWKKSNHIDAIKCLRSEEAFLLEHLSQWVPKFCDAVLQDARTDFYRGVARFTKGFLSLEAENVSSYIKLAESNLHLPVG